MKKIIFFLLIAGFSSLFNNAQAAQTESNTQPDSGIITLKLRAGQLVYLELVDNINTEAAQVGNIIQLKVRSNVVVKGKVVIAANTMALGRITEVSRASANSAGGAKVEVRDVQAVDQQMVNLNATYQITPNNCFVGQPCVVNAGFIITAHVMNDVYVDID
jgi:hypothetical protein